MLVLRPWDCLGWCMSPLPSIHASFSIEATSAVIVLVLGLTYSFIAPVILPICALYFVGASFVYRWLFLYVYEPEYGGAGEIWYELFHGLMIGLILGTLTLLAI